MLLVAIALQLPDGSFGTPGSALTRKALGHAINQPFGLPTIFSEGVKTLIEFWGTTGGAGGF